MGRPSSSRGRSPSRRPEHSKFTTFVATVVTRAEINTPTLLASLVYIDRAKPHLHIALEEWALERVFLGALIVASKVCCTLSIVSQ
jgi:Cyclin, N-terminal domain